MTWIAPLAFTTAALFLPALHARRYLRTRALRQSIRPDRTN